MRKRIRQFKLWEENREKLELANQITFRKIGLPERKIKNSIISTSLDMYLNSLQDSQLEEKNGWVYIKIKKGGKRR